MLKQLHLKNFRKHKDLSIDFQSGITVVRAANEQGKSTLAEAVAYALFGARATRNSDLTTWGEKPNSHAVELSLCIGGQTADIQRSPSGAQLGFNRQRITGQTDTARFIESQWDLPSGSGGRLMLVSQNDIRGVLSEGGAKSTQLIEQLADLNQLDHIINVLQENYHTGKTDLMQHTLGSLKTQQQQTSAEKTERLADMNQAQSQQVRLNQTLNDLQAQQKPLSGSLNALKEEWERTVQAETRQRERHNQMAQLQGRMAAAQSTLDEADIAFEPAWLAQAQAAIDDLTRRQAHWDDYRCAADYQPADFFDGTREQLLSNLAQAVQQRAEQTRQVAGYQAHITLLHQQINDETACPTCRRAWDDLAARQAHQQHIKDQIRRAQAQLDTANHELARWETETRRLQTLRDTPLPKLAEHSRWQTVPHRRYPPVYQWQGDIPQAVSPQDFDQARSELARIRSLQAQADAQSRLKRTAKEQFQAAAAQWDRLQQQAREDERGCRRSVEDLNRQINDVQQKIARLAVQISDVRGQIELAAQRFSEHEKRIGQLQTLSGSLKDEIARYETELKQAQQASALLKLLRKLKPQIAAQVWQKLCCSVSHYFSLMRGETSVVEHSAGGFTVDGHDSTSLSGSTLDILGLAIRVALVKTFMPACDFLLLDEPFAAADTERTANALGFLATLDFAQIIIITHEDCTEAVAEHIITL